MDDTTFETENWRWHVTVTKNGERHVAAVTGTTQKGAQASPPTPAEVPAPSEAAAPSEATETRENFEIKGGRDHQLLMGDVRAEINRRDGKIR